MEECLQSTQIPPEGASSGMNLLPLQARCAWPLGRLALPLLCLLIPSAAICAAEAPATNDYSAVDAIFTRRCLECHDTKDPEANLVLVDFQSLMKGGENGPAIVSGKSEESLLVRMI